MPAVGGGGRGNAGKSTQGARRKQRRAASPTTSRPAPKVRVAPRSPGSDAAQRAGAQTRARAEARNRGRSDAAAPAGAGGYRLTAPERRVRDEEIRAARGRAKGRARAGAGWRALGAGAGVATGTGGERRTIAASTAAERASGVGFLPARAIRGSALALKEDPVGTSKATARGFKDALVGAPGALLKTAVETAEGTAHGDPLRGVKRSGKEYVDDVVRRYGPLLRDGERGVQKFKERAKKEGLSAEIMDATILAAGVGGPVSRGIAATARRGRIGERPRQIVTEPRRRERTSGGEGREQETSAGFFRAARQKRRDEAAFRGQQRVVDRADRRGARPAADGTTRKGAVDAVVREATGAGEVVPSKVTGLEVTRRGVRTRRAPSQRKIAKRERVDYAGRKGRAHQALRRVQREEGISGGGRGAARAYASLSAPEKVAYKAAVQGPRTPAAGKAWAEARIRRIEQAIERGDVDPGEARELGPLRAMAADPGKHFTEHLARVAAAEVERGKRAAAVDPRLGDTPEERAQTGELRRRAPQFTLVGVKRQGRTTAQAERAARARRDRGRKDARKAGRRLLVAERRVGAAEETGRRLDAQARERLGSRKGKGAAEAPATAWFRPRPGARDPQHGRAMIDSDGVLHSWAESEGHHQEVRTARGVLMKARLTIRPDGTVVPTGTFPARFGEAMSDAEAVARAVAQDPRLRPTESMAADSEFQAALDRFTPDRPGSGQVGQAERAAEIHARAAANHRRREQRARSGKTREAHGKMAEAAEERAAAAQGRLVALERSAGQSPAESVRLRKRVVAAHGRRAEVRAEIKRAEEEVKAAAREGRTARALRRQYGRDALDPRTAEAIPDFLERGRARVDEAGLSEPGYFQSTPRESRRFSLFTTGGFRSVPKDRRYKGVLFEQGREDGSFTSYAQGLARNHKAAHNWSLVTDTIAEHSFAWSRNRSVEEIRKELERRGIDPDSVAFWSPGVFKEAGDALETGDASRLAGGDDRLLRSADVVGETLDVGQAQLARAVELAQDTGRFGTSRDWVAVPKGLMDELEADTRPSHWFWRGLDVVKAKQARILLGTSPAWLQFQIASNMLLTTLAGVGPLEVVRAQRWWSRLSDSERAAIEPYVGVGHFHDSLDQVRIGAAKTGPILDAYRGFKAHDFWHKPRKPLRGGAVSQLNPLDALFRVDNAQNNLFRKAILYNRLKRDAYDRMGANVALQQRLLDRAIGHLRYTKPEEAMSRLAADHKVLERHARSVADFLGDYQTYTARERRILGRSVMFYGYLRFSLRFAFYTMPVKHPVMASIIGQLGQLQTEEVRRLLGGNELPFAMGRFFFSSGGELKSINVARANPFLNTVTELDLNRSLLDQARNGLRFLPPVYVALLDQAFSKSSFTNKDFRVEGENQGRPLGDYGSARLRIFLNDMARLNAIYREIDRGAGGGVPQGDDSLLGDRPTVYKRADIVAGIAQSHRQFEERGGAAGSFRRGMLPLVPGPDDSPDIAAKIRQGRGEAAPVKLTREQAEEVEKLRREAVAAGPAASVDPAELEKLRREAALAGG